LQFAVALDEASYLQLDDVVVTLAARAGVGPVLTSGIVTQVAGQGRRARASALTSSSSPRRAARQDAGDREVSTTRWSRSSTCRARPGEVVRRATGTERPGPLLDQMPTGPGGARPDGAPIYLNMEFLDGTRGAHVSISGISGVATKTSFALFCCTPSSLRGAARARRQR